MNKTQNVRLTMHLSVLTVLNQNEVKFSSFSAYPGLKESFDQGVANEQSIASEQESRMRNSVAAKLNVRDTATGYVLDLKNRISACAIVKQNWTLLDKVKFTSGKLKRSSDNKLVLIFETVLAIGAENSEIVLEYGVTEQLLSDGKDLLDNLREQIQNLLLSKAEQKQLTVQLEQQFKITDVPLKTIDAIVKTMQSSDSVLYGVYQSARSIKKSASAKISAIGKVMDATTRQPLPKAKITMQKYDSTKALVSGPDLEKVVKIAGAQGGVVQKSLSTGSYLYTVSYAGYIDQQVIVHVNEGVLTRFEVLLTKPGTETVT